MASGKLFGGANMSVLLQNERLPCPSEVLESLWVHTSDPSPPFLGSKSMVDFENGNRGIINNRVIPDHRSFFQGLEKEENYEDDFDACFNQTGNNCKKRRLSSEQVQFLERNFEIENKLEPERKVQLARELGLQPRQVAIWFQNRRARFKTKQLEKEYITLKACYDKLKGDYENLQQQNDKLKEEVNSLKNILIPTDNIIEKGNSSSYGADAAAIIVNNSPKVEQEETIIDLISFSNTNSEHESKNLLPLPIMVKCKQQPHEDANSAKSDVLDSDSPQHCNNIINGDNNKRHHSSSSLLIGPADDSSRDEEEDNLSTVNLLTLPRLPKVEGEDACYDDDGLPTHENNCGFGFPSEDQAFSFWSY